MRDLDDVLGGAGRGEEGVLVLEPVRFLEEDDGPACEAVF